MGRALTFLFTQTSNPNTDYAHDMLTISYSPSELLDIVKECCDKHGIDVKRGGISTYFGRANSASKYGQTTNDAYGDRMRSVTIGQLKIALKSFKEKGQNYDEVALKKYINACRKEMIVFLYWH